MLSRALSFLLTSLFLKVNSVLYPTHYIAFHSSWVFVLRAFSGLWWSYIYFLISVCWNSQPLFTSTKTPDKNDFLKKTKTWMHVGLLILNDMMTPTKDTQHLLHYWHYIRPFLIDFRVARSIHVHFCKMYQLSLQEAYMRWVHLVDLPCAIHGAEIQA